jgi:molecular chaperone GrpE
VDALQQGYRMTLERLEESLADLGVKPIPCEGQPFDPVRMVAADVLETDEVEDGTVVEVYRNGYEWNGETFRAAQVRVARAHRDRESET